MVSTELVLEFSGLPPVANSRLSWRHRAAEIALYRNLAELQTLSWRNEHDGKTFAHCRVSAEIRTRARLVDPLNRPEYVKPLLDGVVRAGLIPDDSEAYVESGTFTAAHGPRGITLRLESL